MTAETNFALALTLVVRLMLLALDGYADADVLAPWMATTDGV